MFLSLPTCSQKKFDSRRKKRDKRDVKCKNKITKIAVDTDCRTACLFPVDAVVIFTDLFRSERNSYEYGEGAAAADFRVCAAAFHPKRDHSFGRKNILRLAVCLWSDW